jgi:hypothetical protein
VSADGYRTDNLFFAAFLLFTFTAEALIRIEKGTSDNGRTETTFYLDVPSLDCDEYEKEFQEGTLAISDLMSFVKAYSLLTSRLKKMTREGETSWVSSRWVAGRGK